MKLINSLSLIPGQGDGSLPLFSPRSSTGVLGRFGSGGWAMTSAEPGHVPGSVGPDVLLFHWQKQLQTRFQGLCALANGPYRCTRKRLESK